MIRKGWEETMQGAVWTALLRQIPVEKHNQLSLVTTGGTEIALQGVLRYESTYLAIKGRLSGSQDGGRVFFIPYVNIDYLGFQREVKDTEFEEMFGNPPAP